MTRHPYSRGWWDGPFATEDEMTERGECDCRNCECYEPAEDGELCIACRNGACPIEE